MPGRIARGCLRIGSININRLNNEKENHKDKELFDAIDIFGLDATLMQEVGINWSQTPRSLSWQSRVNKHLDQTQTKSYMSHNERDRTGTQYQWGGTGIMTYGKLAHFAMGAGKDIKRLGRWTWTRYRGKNNTVLRLVSVYRPVKASKSTTNGVSQQHHRYLQSIKDDRKPRQAWIEDFEAELKSWITAGDHVIVAGDINTHIFRPSIIALFERNGLTNLIFDRHDKDNAPSTYYKSNGGNGRIVDGMWGTANIDVTACGYLEPSDFPGDHSLVWADVTYKSALGHNPPTPQVPHARRLVLSNTRCTKKYLDIYEQQLDGSNLAVRQYRLTKSTTYGKELTMNQAIEANAIDEQRTIFMRRAEKKCRKIKRGHVAFSLATEIPKRRIAFWTLAIRRRKGIKISSTLWKRKKKHAKITEKTKGMTVDDMIRKIVHEKRTYRAAKKRHKEERKTFLETLRPKDRDRLQRNEAARELGRAAKLVTGKLESKSVTKVIVDGTECNTKQEMESALFKINYAKLRASDDTPFMQPTLVNDFGYTNDTPATEAVLQGTYEAPHNIDPYAHILLQGLQVPQSIKDHPYQPRTTITVDDHIKGWTKAKEKVSSGMSGLHFGMFKANTQRRRLASIDASIRSLAYTTGFTYNRWKKGLDVQLLKRSQDFRAEKQRTIVLLEADFNMNNKVLGSDAMHAGEMANVLTRDNYGGRKGMQPNEVALNSTLTHNSILGRRGRAIIMSNDAKGCYDRIAHTVVHLALRRLGIPKPALQSMLNTIKTMSHHIRTAFGDSKTAYGKRSHEPPPSGILQGNGAGPAGWSALATVIIEAMKEAGFGYNDWSLIRRRAIIIACFAFVDDTDLIHVNNDPTVSTETLIAEAQQALSTWEGLVRATGGALAPEKSYWYLLEVTRKQGKWGFKTKTDSPGELFLQNGTYQVKRHEVSVAEEALGIQSRPDGKMIDELKYLQSKATKWCDAVRTKRLYKSEAWYVFNCTIMKTIEYPLMATSFSKRQLESLMSPILTTILPLAGVQRRLPRKLIYGTLRSRGLNIKDPYLTQLILHLQAILRHQHRNTPTRDLLDDNIDIMQTHVGSATPFWELPFALYANLAPDGWIKNTWEALDDTPLTIKGVDITVKKQRLHDRHIMDVLIYSNKYTDDEINILQDCRLFLEVTTLAQICTADGKEVHEKAWRGVPLDHRRKQPWIRTYKPGPSKWDLWRQALRDNFLFTHAAHRRLRNPLGPWIHNMDDEWRWWKADDGMSLFEHTADDKWRRWTRRTDTSTRTSTRFETPQLVNTTTPPTNVSRAHASHRAGSPYTYVYHIGHHAPANPSPTPTTLRTQLAQLPTSAHWALLHFKTDDDGASIAADLQQHRAVAVSDGSLKLGFGTSAYVIEGTCKPHRIVGVNVVPGPIKDGDSHRCELAGLYGIALMLHGITTLHNVTKGSIRIACDNTQALKVFEPNFLPTPQEQNFDLVNALWKLLQKSPLEWRHEHVKGHQDNKPLHRPLTRLEGLNVEMDHHAKAFWQFKCAQAPGHHMPSPQHHLIYKEGWQIWNGDEKISHPSINNMYSSIQDPITQNYWVRHDHIPAAMKNDVDWDGSADLLAHIDVNRRRWVTKHASDNCGVATTLQTWNHTTSNKCPRCNEAETTEHVYKCTGHEASTPWTKSMDSLNTYLTNTKTDPELQDSLITSLQRWRKGLPPLFNHYTPAIQQLVTNQHTLGWKNFLEGLPLKAWRLQQLHYYRLTNNTKSSKRWLRGMLQHVHHLAWNQWDHRNNIKHRVATPDFHAGVRMLHREITKELLKGTRGLLPGDKHMAQWNRLALFARPLATRKAWYANIIEARARYANQEQLSKEASTLYKWMHTRRPVE